MQLEGPSHIRIPLAQLDEGYWHASVDSLPSDARYRFLLDHDLLRPDPASQRQPEGIRGPSQIVDHTRFQWQDEDWRGLRQSDLVFYEIHVGTFTPGGTFEAILPRIEELRALGITALQLMPVAQFPGARNWGYDGVFPFAVQNTYGTPDDLKLLVDTCHRRGLAVFLDVVYNHVGPEGSVFEDFGPYTSRRGETPWGPIPDFEGPNSDPICAFFVENAVYWLREFHMDGLRLDAVDPLLKKDASSTFLRLLAKATEELSQATGISRILVAESDRNDARLLAPPGDGGLGIHAQWNDDFHHCVHALLTKDRTGVYQDYGDLDQFLRCLREGYAFSGQFSRHRRRPHGTPSSERKSNQFVVCTQNHDQVGNVSGGRRSSTILSFDGMKLAAALTVLSPFLPMFFMGEEYGEESPFVFFTSFSDHDIIEHVRKARHVSWIASGSAEPPPDPQDPETLRSSMINWEHRYEEKPRSLLQFYAELLAIRSTLFHSRWIMNQNVFVDRIGTTSVLSIRRTLATGASVALFNLGEEASPACSPFSAGRWKKMLDSTDPRWAGPGCTLPDGAGEATIVALPPYAVAVFRTTEPTPPI